MIEGKNDVLSTLKKELAFLELGGYRSPQQAAWRPQFIFQDSPTCPNHRNLGEPVSCTECVLMEFVPRECQKKRFPCRYIPLDESGQTLDYLYRTGTEEETHAIVANWLKNTIVRLQQEAPHSPTAAALTEEQRYSVMNH
jgi:hypothetical protein